MIQFETNQSALQQRLLDAIIADDYDALNDQLEDGGLALINAPFKGNTLAGHAYTLGMSNCLKLLVLGGATFAIDGLTEQDVLEAMRQPEKKLINELFDAAYKGDEILANIVLEKIGELPASEQTPILNHVVTKGKYKGCTAVSVALQKNHKDIAILIGQAGGMLSLKNGRMISIYDLVYGWSATRGLLNAEAAADQTTATVSADGKAEAESAATTQLRKKANSGSSNNDSLSAEGTEITGRLKTLKRAKGAAGRRRPTRKPLAARQAAAQARLSQTANTDSAAVCESATPSPAITPARAQAGAAAPSRRTLPQGGNPMAGAIAQAAVHGRLTLRRRAP